MNKHMKNESQISTTDRGMLYGMIFGMVVGLVISLIIKDLDFYTISVGLGFGLGGIIGSMLDKDKNGPRHSSV